MICEGDPMVRGNFSGLSVDIGFRDLSYSIRNGFGFGGENKEILHGISGTFPSGKLIGILGPSGAGKSTLLNILSGFVSNGVSGEIEVNGSERNLDVFRDTSCYITQDNDLHGLLTVEENMQFTADLKLGESVSRNEKDKMIENILKTFGLYNIRDTRTARISGGQMKRLSVCLELISNPMVLFLDEPTTGLDSYASFRCIEYLKYLAGQGKTIICTIHQPSASQFKLFDVVYVLANGKCLYQGEASQLVPFFQTVGMPCNLYHNPADYVIECASGEYGGDVIDTMVEAIENGKSMSWLDVKMESILGSTEINKQKTKLINGKKNKKSDFYELKTLLRRESTKLKRNLSFTWLRIFANVVMSIAIGIAYWQLGKNASKIWFAYNLILANIANLSFPSVMLTLLEFPLQMRILKKEYFNRYYSLKNYFFTITLLDLPVSIFCAYAANVIVYTFTGQPMEMFRLAQFSTIGFLEVLTAQSIGLFVGSICNIQSGVFFGVYMHIPIMLFSGFGMMFCDIPTHFYWFSYLAYLRYGVMATAGSLYGYNRPKLECPDDAYCHYSYGHKFLKDLGIEGEQFWMSCAALVGFYLFFRIISYLAMIKRMKS